MKDGTGLTQRLLGLDGFRALEVTETLHEVVVTVDTSVEFVGCATRGIRAVVHGSIRPSRAAANPQSRIMLVENS